MIRKIEISFGFAALLCLLGWYDWLLCIRFLICLVIHEVGHGAALRLLKIPIWGLSLRMSGAMIRCGFCGYRAEYLSAAAGPAVSFLFSLVMLRVDGLLALISLGLGACNLLPLYPLDGGRMLRCILSSKMEPQQAERCLSAVTVVVCCMLMTGACWLTAEMQMGIWPIFAALVLLWRAGCAGHSAR